MISVKLLDISYQSAFVSNSSCFQRRVRRKSSFAPIKVINRRKLAVRGGSEGGGEEKKNEKRTFLTLEEAGLVEISGLGTHEKFLCRLTISSLNLLRVISEQEGGTIEELNAGRICDWFVKDKLKREQKTESAVLQWDDSDFLL
ncbi:hypothetical protein HS088_TW09G00273 [Tripterygium wilfordii]|uniref:Receptor-interacting protein n=1 Tax=Tripterygium wilfordii TaxID=458696 RepID=A0A7J7D7L0_TRIWF|nr:uncharacterized protein LOC120005482 [Tripterygium wilfordii]KAF5742229.1 hypothetical protein HS088_TW09G00273 [Tripterygium wilfordii]